MAAAVNANMWDRSDAFEALVAFQARQDNATLADTGQCVAAWSSPAPSPRCGCNRGDSEESGMLAPTIGGDPDRSPGRTARIAESAWLGDLHGSGPSHDAALKRLHQTVRRAARYQVARMPQVRKALGATRTDEIVESAADSAVVAVLARLDSFEGRSRFETWVYKFGIHHAQAQAARALWRDRPVCLDGQPEPASRDSVTPESYAEARDFASATSAALRNVLTAHQRRVALALIVEEIPIDVLAERMQTSRNALYKTLHDARVNLRAELGRRGYLPPRGIAS